MAGNTCRTCITWITVLVLSISGAAALGENCSVTACQTKDAVCNAASQCVCKDGFTDVSGSCRPGNLSLVLGLGIGIPLGLFVIVICIVLVVKRGRDNPGPGDKSRGENGGGVQSTRTTPPKNVYPAAPYTSTRPQQGRHSDLNTSLQDRTMEFRKQDRKTQALPPSEANSGQGYTASEATDGKPPPGSGFTWDFMYNHAIGISQKFGLIGEVTGTNPPLRKELENMLSLIALRNQATEGYRAAVRRVADVNPV